MNYRVIVIAAGNNTRKDIMGVIRGEHAHADLRDGIVYEHYVTAPSGKMAEKRVRQAHSLCRNATRIARVYVQTFADARKEFSADGWYLTQAYSTDNEVADFTEDRIFMALTTLPAGKNFPWLPLALDMPNTFIWRREHAMALYPYKEGIGTGPLALFRCSRDLKSMLALLDMEDWQECPQPALAA